MLFAELVAFLWRDSCRAFVDKIAGHEHPHIWNATWAIAMLLFGVMWLRIAHGLRSRFQIHKDADEAMLDVEADACGLAVGHPLFVALAGLHWGEEWSELVEHPKGTASDVMFFGTAFIVSVGLAALALRTLQRRGFDKAQMRALSSGWGFLIAFLMDQFILTLLTGPLHVLFDIKLGDKGDDDGVSVGRIIYPFFVLAMGSLVISYHANKTKSWSRWCDNVFIWSYQIGMALAFEGLLDDVVDIVEDGDTRGAKLAVAIILTVTWVIVCISWAHFCHGGDQDESEAKPELVEKGSAKHERRSTRQIDLGEEKYPCQDNATGKGELCASDCESGVGAERQTVSSEKPLATLPDIFLFQTSKAGRANGEGAACNCFPFIFRGRPGPDCTSE
eukprot:CAMPEP_0115172662 /NCGR_PEP_ID=MMETSP0270-20121206/2931_1 /TAXON_ID=71861 /ORGANISM="Scrippsiella trochoidea, Strain CCMP3099" /LENGTH=389 /DNA_ID=CAMNT_0002585461 /DNA_START=239 /DNA_END=1405 /DNA_ORIENTATION=+